MGMLFGSSRGVPQVEHGGNPSFLLRHAAILLATLAAWIFRNELHPDGDFLWLLGAAALMNLAVFSMSTRGALLGASRVLSPLVGLSSWTALVHVTGGSGSPLVAGLGLEIVLSAMTFGPAGTATVSAAAAAALWAQALPGAGGTRTDLALQGALLLSIGGVACAVRSRWERAHDRLLAEADAARRQLQALEEELEDLRALGQVGANVARLGHGLKNAVCALRGFTRLVEARASGGAGEEEIQEGLRRSVDRLEEISRMLLSPSPPAGDGSEGDDVQLLGRIIDDSIEEASRRHARVRWTCNIPDGLAAFRRPARPLREVFGVLLDNAAEAMNGQGEVRIAAEDRGGRLEIEVRDSGCGIAPARLADLFRPGRTTKPAGNGFGLFLARNLIETCGGTITVSAGPAGGTSFAISIPHQEATS